MKKVIIIGLSILVVITLLAVVGNWYYKSQKENSTIVNPNKEFEQLENKVADLEEETPSKKVVENEDRDVELEEIPVGRISKDKFKVAVDSDTCNYEKEGESGVEEAEKPLEVDVSNRKAYITMSSENELLQSIAQSEDVENLTDLDAEEITGFSSEPVEVFFGDFGQDIVEMKLLFLMKDGSVEYINVVDMLKNQSYKSQGKIKNLENIKQFECITVSDTDGGGYITTIAIDEDGYYYDLNELF